jgi:hypothetical protein
MAEAGAGILLQAVITAGDDHDPFPSAALACLTELERLFFVLRHGGKMEFDEKRET